MGAYYLIGEHLSHSFSPEIHRSFGRYDYALQELVPDELGEFLKTKHFSGLNVTIPYKQTVIPYLDRLDPQAAAIGAVNTIVNRDGVLWGYNTDFGGMLASLNALGCGSLAGKTVLILGTGGTSKTALAVCEALGVGKTVLVSRSGKVNALSCDEALRQCPDAAWIIHCTPVGMYPDLDGRPVKLAAVNSGHSEQSEESAPFPQLQAVFDCVYNPLRTRLILEAMARGITAAGGLYMLVKQAALACELFTGRPVKEFDVEQVCKKLRIARENLVLVGMPGSGKTSVGRLLAEKTGRSFVDLDDEIVRRAGKSIPAVFSQNGESAFRDMETAVVRAVSAEGGKIIATGGGTILREENVCSLKQNGRLIFLNRPLEGLVPTENRPLGDTPEKLHALYAERYSRYVSAADFEIPNQGSIEDAVCSIRTLLSL